MTDHILLVSVDKEARRDLSETLSRFGYQVSAVADGDGAQGLLSSDAPDLILLDDPWPGDLDADRMEAWAQDLPILVLCGEDGMEVALQALRLGASEFLAKPVDPQELAGAVRRIIDNVLLYRRGEFYTSVLRHEAPSLLVGESAPLLRLLADLKAVAATEATVLILGESGVGKEKVAQEIHRLSPRAEGPLVAVDCCSLPETLFESELFGHERGAFTGAAQRKPGLIEQAKDGTLFLDEIGEIPAPIQAKLLRVLETKRFRRLGSATDLKAEVRIVAATNRDLDGMAQRGEFRQDLLYRLNSFVVDVPPLRERREDIPPLVRYFLAHHGQSKRIVKRASASAMQQLVAYDWPGNVRELRNIVERAIILSGNKLKVDPEHLTLSRTPASAPDDGVTLRFDHEPTLAEIERSYLKLLLERHEGHRSAVARALGIGERTLYRLLADLKASSEATE
ncbi:sigma-54-dependent transcriptional regulator [Thiocapsa marina]|uniref:Two component, sigma54 specific, transcriptional regulator, Fis family n=1 Tax=Thiocapsa marina 5811 TaxID=768671 RepID=F9UDP0_9GAMM|nr:sigma-54 dependent transcriptional regulator [Thiocapsa marina]EGV17687.1 two component, sigma54 specific, transcriptional regulator, Fis family [Thiocapsa marina 5811]